MPTLYTDRPKNGYHLVITMIKQGAVTLIIHDTSYDILIKIVALPLSLYITNQRSILLHTGWYWFSGGSSLEVIDDRSFQLCYRSVVLQCLFPSSVKSKPRQWMSREETLLTHSTCKCSWNIELNLFDNYFTIFVPVLL
jgi:hypothetical protein